MKKYEAVFILDERKYGDGGEEFANGVVKHVEKLGGRMLKKDPMGRRQFARPIRKQKAGIYWDFQFDMLPESIETFKDAYRLESSILRLVAFLYDGLDAE